LPHIKNKNVEKRWEKNIVVQAKGEMEQILYDRKKLALLYYYYSIRRPNLPRENCEKGT
jgi:hypothetical protein